MNRDHLVHGLGESWYAAPARIGPLRDGPAVSERLLPGVRQRYDRVGAEPDVYSSPSTCSLCAQVFDSLLVVVGFTSSEVHARRVRLHTGRAA